jgi:hypothetical protein
MSIYCEQYDSKQIIIMFIIKIQILSVAIVGTVVVVNVICGIV